jgi:eukaryotic-like serine/threonine-protein kinase
MNDASGPAPAQASSPLMPGYFLDRYELLCPLADGGMASVWVARLRGKHGFEKLVAIKTILPQFAADERFQQMFLDETRIASRIEHANVAQIVDVGEQHDITYLVMEWVDGDSLSRLYRALKKKNIALPMNVLLRIVADACGGLHAAHELRDDRGALLGVVHRDVSPQNILVSSRGMAKLIDFGIAKARDRVVGETNAGLLKGKIHYMAPEQALGGTVDRRADVFAVGALLYHLLSGAPPFDGQNQLAVLQRLTSKQPPMPLSSAVPPQVAAVVRRSLAYSPDARFATAAELQAAIESAMIETRLTCTQAQVADFVAAHGASRTASRKEAIDLALSAAAERARVRDVLRPNPDKSATGVLASGAEFQHTGDVVVGARQPTDPSLAGMPQPVPPPAPSSSIQVDVVVATSNKGKIFAIVGAAVVLIAAIAVGAFFVGSRQSTAPTGSATVATSKPTATATASAKATPAATTTAEIEIPVVDLNSLPTATPTATGPSKPADTAHVTGPSTTATAAAPTATATTTTRRSTYGF